jgi:hypothetical protein
MPCCARLVSAHKLVQQGAKCSSFYTLPSKDMDKSKTIPVNIQIGVQTKAAAD